MLIAHATELTGDDDLAFVHATALAIAGSARLVTVHGNAPPEVASKLPDARALASRWGRSVVHERHCHECCDDVTDTVVDAMLKLAPDLVVLGTHARHGFSALLKASIGEAIARNLTVPALIVPNHSRGFVDLATGVIGLGRILIPAGTVADAARGAAAARDLLALTKVSGAELEVVHVGGAAPELRDLGLPVTIAEGSFGDAVTRHARIAGASLIVMPTRGHDGLGDALLGSHTERVIHEAGCPVLSVPM